MDFVLEGFDTYIFDAIYAFLFPWPGSSTGSLKAAAANSTTGSIVGDGRPLLTNGYVFQPASKYWQFSPGEKAYLTTWPRDDVWRQAVSLYFITWLFGMLVYFFFASLSYYFVFDQSIKKHPRYLKNQVRLEITQTLVSLPIMAIFTAPLFWLEVRGFSKMYDTTAEGPGTWYNFLQFPFFIMFTDCFIYWIHRSLHHPLVYKRLHKPHHKWVIPTPYASHAFHPIDGFAQSIPYHVFPFLFPLQKFAYVILFVFINIWTILIHDGEYVSQNPVVNGAACHNIHHTKFEWNYGQFTTLWDRMGGTYSRPPEELFHKGSATAESKKER